TDLALDDASRAGRALWSLAADPEGSAPFLGGQLQSAIARIPAEALAKLIRDLDADGFEARVKAQDELEKLGEVAEPEQRKALEKAPSLESKKRLEELLAKGETNKTHPSGELLRQLRAV